MEFGVFQQVLNDLRRLRSNLALLRRESAKKFANETIVYAQNNIFGRLLKSLQLFFKKEEK